MHLEVLVEDSSGCRLLGHLLPKLLGPYGEAHTWRLHDYRGMGRVPRNLAGVVDPSKRILLDRLPAALRGYSKTNGIDAVLVVVDTDNRDCAAFLRELKDLAHQCGAGHLTMFRLAIEETEAWYFGDQPALLAAYPAVAKGMRRMNKLARYQQDSVCGTWEWLADITHPAGSRGTARPRPGDLKHEWAGKIGPLMDPDRNRSPSFGKLRDGLRKLTNIPAPVSLNEEPPQ